MKTALEIFESSFLFKNMREMKEAIDEDRREAIFKAREGFPREYIIQGDGESQILICNGHGRLWEDPISWVKYPTKKDILSWIESVIDHYGENIPHFTIETDAHLYFYESFRYKIEGGDAEPLDEYYGISLLEFKP